MEVHDETAIEKALRRLPGWEQADDVIAKTFVHDSFRSAMLFVERIADLTEGAAEVAGHRPWIDIRSNTVVVAIPIDDANGPTSADIVLAHRIQGLAGAHRHPPGLAGNP